jgi:hypothetical protein
MYNSSNQNIYGQPSAPGFPSLPSIVSYSTGNRHKIKTYTNSGHVFYNPISQNLQVQPDILSWINNH